MTRPETAEKREAKMQWWKHLRPFYKRLANRKMRMKGAQEADKEAAAGDSHGKA